MVINRPECKNVVEFVSYTGKYPNLCSGVLTLKINGKTYIYLGMNKNMLNFGKVVED